MAQNNCVRSGKFFRLACEEEGGPLLGEGLYGGGEPGAISESHSPDM